jgi:hypothetical protein
LTRIKWDAPAFQGDDVLVRSEVTLEDSGYLTHEFGDSVLVFSRTHAH